MMDQWEKIEKEAVSYCQLRAISKKKKKKCLLLYILLGADRTLFAGQLFIKKKKKKKLLSLIFTGAARETGWLLQKPFVLWWPSNCLF